MSKSTTLTGFAILPALAALLAACDTRPTGPSIPPPRGSVITRLEVVGPDSVPPGETAQFNVTAHLSNGTSRNVTSEARWHSSAPSVLSIAVGGLAAAHERGEATLSAHFEFYRSTREVIVVPRGTYRLTGVVSEAGATAVPLVDARVEVIAGSAVGLSTATAEAGGYRLYGVAGLMEIRVSRDGYQPHVGNLTVADHQTENFELTLVQPRANFAGTYTLTIGAAAECRDRLPEEARIRTYTADLSQNGPQLLAQLTGATFSVLKNGRGSRFSGAVESDAITFWLTPYTWYYKGYGEPYGDLVEEITPSMYLVVDGRASARASPRELSGTLDGSFQVFSSDPRWGPRATAECRSQDHLFTFSR